MTDAEPLAANPCSRTMVAECLGDFQFGQAKGTRKAFTDGTGTRAGRNEEEGKLQPNTEQPREGLSSNRNGHWSVRVTVGQ